MSEATINAITPQWGAANETRIGDLTSYFRWNEESRQYEINSRIDPAVSTEQWSVSPSPVRDRFCNPSTQPTLGEIVWAMNNSYLREDRVSKDRLNFSNDAYRAIEIIGERLLQESQDRGWCDEFDRIIDEVNESLPGPFALPVREKEYEVTWEETVTVTVSRSTLVTARNEEDAIEQVREGDEVENHEVLEAVRDGNWEADWNCSPEYDVSEV
jgi:hypothetical protein